MEKEEYNSRFGRYGPVTINDHPTPENPEKKSLAEIVLDISLFGILTLGAMYGCWKAYDYADTQRREAIRAEQEGN